jgi:hypothetical protein
MFSLSADSPFSLSPRFWHTKTENYARPIVNIPGIHATSLEAVFGSVFVLVLGA